jgi:hypothetical protein
VWRLDSSDSRQGLLTDSCEHGNEPSGSIRGGEFLECLGDYRLLKKESTPGNQYIRSSFV